MMVKIGSLDFGGPFVAEVLMGSVASGKISLFDTGATYFLKPNGKWLDADATPEFRGIEYEISEVEDPSKSTTHNEIAEDYPGLKPAKIEPSALMEIIGNIPAGHWSKISAMANEEIKNTFTGLKPVNKAQVIRCLYAFERYARENGLIKLAVLETDAEPFEYEAGLTRVKYGGVTGIVQSCDGPIAYVRFFNDETSEPDPITTPVLIRKLTRI